MIIELFGPPAAGKTTLAHALATALEKNGFDVQLIVSSRPAERWLGPGREHTSLVVVSNGVGRPSEQGGQVGQCRARSADRCAERRTHCELDGSPAASHSFAVGSLSPISFLAIALLEDGQHI